MKKTEQEKKQILKDRAAAIDAALAADKAAPRKKRRKKRRKVAAPGEAAKPDRRGSHEAAFRRMLTHAGLSAIYTTTPEGWHGVLVAGEDFLAWFDEGGRFQGFTPIAPPPPRRKKE
jgi:hypothetical protein